MNKSGYAFVQFILDSKLAVPASFAHLHTGPTATWTHSQGRRSRKDYVLLPAYALCLVSQSHVDTNHDNAFAHDDHVPVTLCCTGWMSLAAPTPKHAWDERAFLNADTCRQFNVHCSPCLSQAGTSMLMTMQRSMSPKSLRLANSFSPKSPRRPIVSASALPL